MVSIVFIAIAIDVLAAGTDKSRITLPQKDPFVETLGRLAFIRLLPFVQVSILWHAPLDQFGLLSTGSFRSQIHGLIVKKH